MSTKPNPYQGLSFIKNDGITSPKITRPSDGIGRFEYFQGTLKQAVESGVANTAGSPFSNAKLGGSKDWQSSNTFGTDSRIKLIDNDGDTASGYITLKLADNWQGLFYVKTENNDFFQDNVKENWVEDNWTNADGFIEEFGEAVNLLETEGWPSVWVQNNAENSDSRMIFGLDSTDYFSFDIDDESNNAAQARVRIGGDDYLSNTEADDEIWITCVFLRYWNDAYIWPALPENDDDDQCPEGFELVDGECVPIEKPDDGCPEGQSLNEFGICVAIPEPEYDKECEDGYTWNEASKTCELDYDPADDVSTIGMIALLSSIAFVIYLAIRRV